MYVGHCHQLLDMARKKIWGKDPENFTDNKILLILSSTFTDIYVPENFIPFGDPTLPGPHKPHLPWGKDLTDNKIWIYTLKGYLYPDDNETKDISKAIKSMFDGPYNNWKCCNDKIKEIWFNEWAKNYKWIGEQEATIRATWDSKAKDLLRKIMARVCEKVSEKPKWKGSQTFVDKRSTDAYKNFVNLCSQVESQPHPSEVGNNESGTQPKPIDYDTLMIEAVGGRNAKGGVYGLGLDGSMHNV